MSRGDAVDVIARKPAQTRRPPSGAARGDELRVLVMSHLDPRLSKGGAEIAALQLYEELKSRPGVSAWLLTASAHRIEQREGVTFGQPFGADNFVYYSRTMEWFTFSNPHAEMRAAFVELLHELKPNVVHLHHYINFGVEMLHAIRAALPDARIVLTLHEYLAICHHQGQMVKNPSFSLCDRATPQDCHRCFPDKSPQDFFLREMYVKRFLRLADAYVAPSQFLARRYVEWGLDPDRFAVIENGVPDRSVAHEQPYPALEHGVVFGFFGQISRLKGIDVLFDAAEQLGPAAETVQIEIHGDVSAQPEAHQQAFRKRLDAAPRNLRFVGPYDNARVGQLMQSVHAVVVPSIWWENSPLVIQEALANRRPVLCSDVGGMAEKVRDGIDGFHFRVGNGWSLAMLMRRLAGDPTLLSHVQATMAPAPRLARTTDALVALYRAG